MKPLTIAVDVDGVTADLHTELLRRYNNDYNDSLTLNQITDWYIVPFVKPECGEKILDYFKLHTLYNNIQPICGAVEGINYLRDLGHRIVFASSCASDTEGDKLKWLFKHKFIPIHQHIDFCKDWLVVSDKSLVYADLMIDDRPENLQVFRGVGIIFDQPYNRKALADARLKGWADLPRVMSYLYPMFEEAIYADVD